jgi:hypothetical protein
MLAVLCAIAPVFANGSPHFDDAFLIAAFGIPAIVCSNLAPPAAKASDPDGADESAAR